MRATKQQVQTRIDELVRILLAGAKPIDIREFVSERSQDATSCWHVLEGEKPLSDKQIFNYARKAGEAIAASTKETRRGRIRRHLAQREYLYAQAVAAADYRTALSCLRDMDELLGLYPAKGVELTGKGGAAFCPPLEALVAAVIAAERGGGGGNGEEPDTDASGKDPQGDGAGDGPEALRGETLP